MNALVKLVLTLLVGAFASIPTWLFLGLRSALNPQGFWEQLATGVVGWALFGAAQIALFLFFLFASFAIWTTSGGSRASFRGKLRR